MNVLIGTALVGEDQRGIIKGETHEYLIQKMKHNKVSIFRYACSANRSQYKVFGSMDELLEEFSFDEESMKLILVAADLDGLI